MALIDAVFINNGGGKILLDYLYEVLSQEISEKYVFLIDRRLHNEYSIKKCSHISIVFINGLLERNRFYKSNRNCFSVVLCFGNIPPNLRLKAKVYTYFQQRIYLDIPSEFSFTDRVKFKFKIFVLKAFRKNSDFWLVQSDLIKNELQEKMRIMPGNVFVMPFYPPLDDTGVIAKASNSFLYVSTGSPHKNHRNLVNAFCMYFDCFKKGILTLTVSQEFSEVYNYIAEKVRAGYPIVNLGFIKREELCMHYRKSEYLVFPSLAESYGLGIVEAIECGCKVIGADLPYTHEICNPSLTFNPYDTNSIFEAFCITESRSIPATTLRTKNNVKELVKILRSNFRSQEKLQCIK